MTAALCFAVESWFDHLHIANSDHNADLPIIDTAAGDTIATSHHCPRAWRQQLKVMTKLIDRNTTFTTYVGIQPCVWIQVFRSRCRSSTAPPVTQCLKCFKLGWRGRPHIRAHRLLRGFFLFLHQRCLVTQCAGAFGCVVVGVPTTRSTSSRTP